MKDFLEFFYVQPGFLPFLNGMSLVVLASVLRIVPQFTRDKLHFDFFIPALFCNGAARIVEGYAGISESFLFSLTAALLKVISISLMAEPVRKILRTDGQPLPAYFHLPILLISMLLAFTGDHQILRFYQLMIGVIICIAFFRSAVDLPTASRNTTRICIILALTIISVSFITNVSEDQILSGIARKTPNTQILIVTFLSAVILLNRYRAERRAFDQQVLLHALVSPALFIAAMIVLSFAGNRIYNYMEIQEKSQAEVHLDNAIESLTLFVNQKVSFAGLSSGIMANAPIMSNYLQNSSEENLQSLNHFLEAFNSNNPSAICYLMDSSGFVHAASSRKDVFLGNHLHSREYFKAAMQGKHGTLIDIGLFTNEPGYYASRPVRDNQSNIIGVCAVKSNLEDLNEQLQLFHPAMLMDSNNRIFLSSNSSLTGKKFDFLTPASAADSDKTLHTVYSPEKFIFATRTIASEGWKVIVFQPKMSTSNNKVWLLTTLVLITVLLVTLLHGTVLASETRAGFKMAQEQFRAVFFNTPESVIILSAENLKLLAANNSARNKFVISSDFSTQSFRSLISETNTKIRNFTFDAKEKLFKHERDFVDSYGTTFTAEVTGSRIFFNGQRAIIFLIHDISQHKQVEYELTSAKNTAEEANLLKTRFFANASHEIRTPLTAIIGLTEMARNLCSSSEQLKILDLIKTSEKSLLTLLNDILDLEQIESGRFSLKPSAFNLHRLLHNVMELVSHRIGQKALKASLKILPNCPTNIIADHDRLRQVLLNLLDNSVKFTSNGEITLEAGIKMVHKKPELMLSVHDTGKGISESLQNDLFQPFANSNPLQRNAERGTGLGLTICKQIVDTMQGTLSFTTRPGEGTSFFLTIPIKIASGEELQITSDTDSVGSFRLETAGRPLKFLVADDNDINLFLAGSIIEKNGGVSIFAKNGLEVIELMKHTSFDAVLIDIQMPELDGLEAIKHIRNSENSAAAIPIIAVSAFGSEHEKNQAIEAGADRYLHKPYFPVDLLNCIQIVMDLKPGQNDTAMPDTVPRNSLLAAGQTLSQINLDEFRIRIPDKPENIAQISEIFARRSVILLHDLQEHQKNADMEKLRETAHSLKGLTGMLSASKAAGLARELEDHCREGNFKKACELINPLMECITGIREDLEILNSKKTV